MMEPNLRQAQTDHPVHELIANRWSPYIFDGRPVEADKLLSCLEAARWAASSRNEQPWRFIIARRENKQAFATAMSCLAESNQVWAQHAGTLLFSVASTKFIQYDKLNQMAEHDVGLALGNLSLQATALGLYVHEMAGVLHQQIRETYQIPQGFKPLTGLAIGYYGGDVADQTLHQREAKKERSRMSLNELVFEDKWQNVSTLV